MEKTSGVKFPPPLLYLAGFLAGVALEAACRRTAHHSR